MTTTSTAGCYERSGSRRSSLVVEQRTALASVASAGSWSAASLTCTTSGASEPATSATPRSGSPFSRWPARSFVGGGCRHLERGSKANEFRIRSRRLGATGRELSRPGRGCSPISAHNPSAVSVSIPLRHRSRGLSCPWRARGPRTYARAPTELTGIWSRHTGWQTQIATHAARGAGHALEIRRRVRCSLCRPVGPALARRPLTSTWRTCMPR
jgi:hypothetical protein